METQYTQVTQHIEALMQLLNNIDKILGVDVSGYDLVPGRKWGDKSRLFLYYPYYNKTIDMIYLCRIVLHNTHLDTVLHVYYNFVLIDYDVDSGKIRVSTSDYRRCSADSFPLSIYIPYILDETIETDPKFEILELLNREIQDT